MTESCSGYVRLSDSQQNKLKALIVLTLRLSAGMIGTNENNFPHNLKLKNRQVASFRNVFTNGL